LRENNILTNDNLDLKFINLNNLYQFTGPLTEQQLKEFIDIYIVAFKTKLDDFKIHIAQENWNDAQDIAHSFKSSSIIVGATKFSKICENFDSLAKTNCTSDVCRELSANIVEMGNSVFKELQSVR